LKVLREQCCRCYRYIYDDLRQTVEQTTFRAVVVPGYRAEAIHVNRAVEVHASSAVENHALSAGSSAGNLADANQSKTAVRIA